MHLSTCFGSETEEEGKEGRKMEWSLESWADWRKVQLNGEKYRVLGRDY